MSRRVLLGGALGVALLIVLLTGIRPNELRGDEKAAASPDPTAAQAMEPFRHSQHVSKRWLRGEVKRDCQVCHDFSRPNHEPVNDCTTCHYNRSSDNAPTLRVQGRVANYKKTMPSFRHEDHVPKGMACIECHIDPKKKSLPRVPDEIWVPRGLGWCTQCHDPAGPDRNLPGNRKADKPSIHQGFQRTLNASANMVGKPDDVFRHEDHLTAQQLRSGNLAACNECHKDMADAEPNIGEKLFRESDCTSCHLAGSNQPMGIGIRDVPGNPLVSKADHTFFHRDHLSMKAIAKDPRLSSQGCFLCHDYNAGAASEGEKYPVKPKYETFAGCVECHQQSKVPGAIARSINDHGEVDNCFGCHTIGSDGADVDMKTNRPRIEIKRREPGNYRFLAHAHPHITGADGKTQACIECHVSERAELPSRIREKPFAHGPHMNQDPKLQVGECASCHVPDKENGRMEMAKIDGFHINYSAESCLECHREVGKTKLEPLEYKTRTDTVVLFSHHDHFTAEALAKDPNLREKSCLACHEAQDPTKVKATGHDYAYAKGTLDCLSCHDHKDKWQQTGNINQQDVEGCMDCHKVGVPRTTDELPIRRIEARGLRGTQFHPLPSEKACAECHVLQPKTLLAGAQLEALTQVRTERTYKENLFHRFADGGGAKPEGCGNCHWHDLDNPTRRQQSGLGRSEKAIRTKWGNTLGKLPAK